MTVSSSICNGPANLWINFQFFNFNDKNLANDDLAEDHCTTFRTIDIPVRPLYNKNYVYLLTN